MLQFNRIKMFDEINEKVVNVPVDCITEWLVLKGEYGYEIAVITDKRRLLKSHNLYFYDIHFAEMEIAHTQNMIKRESRDENGNNIYHFLFYGDEAYFKYVRYVADRGIKVEKVSDSAKLLREHY